VSAFITLSWWFALQGAGAGVYVAGFADTYLLDAYSLCVPALVLVIQLRGAPGMRSDVER
jgi:hypothetical protein